MELRHLEVFVAVAEERSFSRAADRLHVAQSAVSTTIRNLEAELGVGLLKRTSRRVELTSAGAEVLPEARRTLAAAHRVHDAVDEVRGGLRGTVRLGIVQVRHGTRLGVAALLAAFVSRHPGVRIVTRLRASAIQTADVLEGRLDLALVCLPGPYAPGLEVRALGREDLQVAVPRGHALAGRASVTLSDLAGERFVDVPPDWGTRITVDRAFADAGLTRAIDYEVNDTASVVDFVREGLAIAVVAPSFGGLTADPEPGPLAADARAAQLGRGAVGPAVGRDVVLLPFRGRAPQSVMSIVTPADRPLAAATRALRDIALQLAEDEGPDGRPADA